MVKYQGEVVHHSTQPVLQVNKPPTAEEAATALKNLKALLPKN